MNTKGPVFVVESSCLLKCLFLSNPSYFIPYEMYNHNTDQIIRLVWKHCVYLINYMTSC